MNFYTRRRQTEYEQWIQDPVYTLDGEIIDHRWEFIDVFCNTLEKFLGDNGYRFGKNTGLFRRKFAYFWFFLEQAYWKNMYLQYDKPLHRNHDYDHTRFFDVIDMEIFLGFTTDNAIEGFCDDSDFGEHIRAELRYFIYCYIDLDNSPAHEEVHERLHQEAEERKLQEDMKKNPHKYIGGNGAPKHEYDVSELGYFRGDRIMT